MPPALTSGYVPSPLRGLRRLRAFGPCLPKGDASRPTAPGFAPGRQPSGDSSTPPHPQQEDAAGALAVTGSVAHAHPQPHPASPDALALASCTQQASVSLGAGPPQQPDCASTASLASVISLSFRDSSSFT